MDLIIGAGISGISYANFTDNDYLIIEQSSSPGGYCKTTYQDGFVWDYSGHFFHFRQPEIEAYVCKNIAPEILRHVEKHTQILYKGQYINFPFQKNIHQLAKEEFIDCIYDLFTTPDIEPHSFKEMVCANLGLSIAEKFLIPYNEKLYACDLDQLDMNAMGRFFPKASKEEIIRNFRNGDNKSYNSYFVYPETGAIEYINSLLKNIDMGKLSLGEKLLSVNPGGKIAKTNLREIHYDNLISTIPFPRLLDRTGIIYPTGLFSCNKVLVLNLGFDSKGTDRTNCWIYIPSKEYIFYRVGYYDNIIKSGKMSLYVEISFPENAQLGPTKTYLERVLTDLKKTGVLTTQKLIAHQSVLMDPAYVHINKQSINAVTEYKSRLASNDIYSIGRYGSWTYCSIEDNIMEAKQLSETIRHK